MRFMKHIWPKRLYSQLLFAVAIALFVAQAINAYVMINIRYDRMINEAGGILINSMVNHAQFDGSREASTKRESVRRQNPRRAGPRRGGQRFGGNIDIMRSADPLRLSSFIIHQDLSDRAAYTMGAGLNEPIVKIGNISQLPETLRGRVFERHIQRRLERDNEALPTQAIILSYKNENGQWISAARSIRPLSSRVIWGLIFQTLLIYALILSVVAFIAYRISKPLDRLKNAMAAFGDGQGNDIEVQGPHDVRELIENYNDMRGRISSLLSEKDVMLGAIGHDLKTPLASLRVRVESIENHEEREQMVSSIDDMNMMLNDILTLARLGNSSEAVQKTDIGALIETVVDDFPEQRDDIIFTSCGSIAAVIRPALLRRALRNIIGNALRYGGNAHIITAQNDGDFSIMIDDDGPGISADKMETVFEPFQRLDESRNSALGGTGLGLTISRAIVRAHGGDIKLESRVPKGLRATITLPI